MERPSSGNINYGHALVNCCSHMLGHLPVPCRGRLVSRRPVRRIGALLHESELVRAGGWNGHYEIQTNAVVSRVESEKTQ